MNFRYLGIILYLVEDFLVSFYLKLRMIMIRVGGSMWLGLK